MCNIKAGQKVVCLDALVRNLHTGDIMPIESGLVEGQIYTVAAVRYHPTAKYTSSTLGGYVLDLVGVTPPDNWPNFKGYNVLRFRPVVERKTDISIFKAMLNPSKQKVEA